MSQKAKCLQFLWIQLRSKTLSWALEQVHAFWKSAGSICVPLMQLCVSLLSPDAFESRGIWVFPHSVSAFHLSVTSKVFFLGCPMQKWLRDGPGSWVPDTSEHTEDPRWLLTDVKARLIAFGQMFLSLLSLNIQIFGPLASGTSDHSLLYLWHCPVRMSLGNLTCWCSDTSLDAMIFPEKKLHFHIAWLRSWNCPLR